jgi:hypothetical protein
MVLIMRQILHILLLVWTATLFVSCSAGSVTTPSGDNKIPGVLVSDTFPDGSPSEGFGMMGLYNLSLDPDSLTGELSPLRRSSLEDVLEEVDITNFLQLAPCVDCAKLKSIALDPDGNLVVSIGIRHPFPAGDLLKPISGKNRGDLHVFNVEGILFSNAAGLSFPGLAAATAGFTLMNADGYTGYLDASIDEIYPTGASIHPFITHFDDYSDGNYSATNPMGFESVTTPPPSGKLVMAMGCDYDYKDYVLSFPSGSADLLFAIGCTYAVSAANKMQRFTPEYRVPQHNKKAASEVGIEIISNDLRGGITSSIATLHVKVVDINHGVPVGDELDQMKADSSVSGVSIEIPGVTSGIVEFPLTPLSGTGHNPSDPLVFEGVVTNAAGGVEGAYAGMVKVTDSYSPGLNESPLLNGMDGIKRVDPLINPLTALFTINEFATYQAFEISVTSGCTVPTDLIYNLVISTVRSSTSEVTALRLDWDSQTDATDYFIYRKDPFDPSDEYILLDDGISLDNFFEDTTILGNQGYQYYVAAEYCGEAANPSNEVLALLENAEDNVNTASQWITDAGGWGQLVNGRTEFAPFGTCYKPWAPSEVLFAPANGDFCWHHSGWDGWYGAPMCGNMWTSHFTLLCSPAIPIMDSATTAYVEYNVLTNQLAAMFEQAGGSVGVAEGVSNDTYWPSNDLREGWGYNCQHIEGLSRIWYTGKANFPNCTSDNDYGYGLQPGYVYHFAAYNLPDLLTTPDARVTFTWGASNSVTYGALNYDDIAVIVY